MIHSGRSKAVVGLGFLGAVALAAALAMTAGAGSPEAAGTKPPAYAGRPVVLNETDFQDRVYACWLGKTIGTALGLPFRGVREPNEATFYVDLKRGEPTPDEGLDLQFLGLKAMEDGGEPALIRTLAELWPKHVSAEWSELGVACRNLRAGFLPPLSGEFDNAKWKHGNDGWIRAELWACLAPGNPALAARLALQDAGLDHGTGEGTTAAVFVAAIESAAFVEPDRDRLLTLGLAMIPKKSGVARAVQAVLDARKAGRSWKLAREEVILATSETGWQQAPRDVGFMVLAWIYGNGDFGWSVCLAVNAGDTPDYAGGTVAAIFGILGGTKAIPAKWREPISENLKTSVLTDFTGPANLKELTRRAAALAPKVLASGDGAVAIGSDTADLQGAAALLAAAPPATRPLWERSPYVISWTEPGVRVTFDYKQDPYLAPGIPFQVKITLENRSTEALPLEVHLDGMPRDWQASCSPSKAPPLAAGGSAALDVTLMAPSIEEGPHCMTVVVTGGPEPIRIPVGFIGREAATLNTVGPDDVALASKGAVASADSELGQEAPASKIIDGILATTKDFRNRWHSSEAIPHPHWVQVKLPKAQTISRAVIRFADPAGHPVDFSGQVLGADGRWVEIFRRDGYADPRSFRVDFKPVEATAFRLFIFKSSDARRPTAAQISEIELYPPAKPPEK